MPLRLRSAGGGSVLLKPPVALAADVSMEVPAYDGAKVLTDKTPGAVLQIQSAMLNGQISVSGGGAPDTITNGAQLFGINFTPVSASSKILVQTSSVAVAEEANAGDMCWLALWNGSSYVAGNSGTWLYNHFTNNYNGAYLSINELFNAGSTATRLIQVRGGSNGGSAYINGNSTYNYNSINAQVRMVIWEIAA